MIHDHFRCRWPRGAMRLRGGMEALGTTNENCARVTRWWIWEIRIDSDHPWGLAQLEDKTGQFLRGTVWVAGRLGTQNLCSFWNEQAVGAWKLKLHNSIRELEAKCWDIGKKNYAIPRGNWQFDVGSLVGKTTQVLEVTNSLLSGAASGKNCIHARRVACW